MTYEIIKAKKGRKVKYYFHHQESGSIWSTRTNYCGKTIPISGVFTTERIKPEDAPKWVKQKWEDFLREE